MSRAVRVVIADDRGSARLGLRALLEEYPQVKVIGEAANGQELVKLVVEVAPTAVLMDVRMPVMDGLEATRYIKRHWPDIRVVILTMYPGYRSQALAAGADVVLLKGCPSTTLLEAMVGEAGMHLPTSEMSEISPRGG